MIPYRVLFDWMTKHGFIPGHGSWKVRHLPVFIVGVVGNFILAFVLIMVFARVFGFLVSL